MPLRHQAGDAGVQERRVACMMALVHWQVSTSPPAPLEPGISVVVPCYHSERTVAPLVERLVAVLEDLSAQGYEIILVNDGSTDATWASIQRAAERYEHVLGIDLMRNYGQHNAVLCGTRAARYDVTVTMDDDLQHPPEEIPKLVAGLEEQYDVVYGRPTHLPHSPLRNLLSRASKLALARAVGNPAIREVNAFRIFRTDLRRGFADYMSPALLFDVLLGWTTKRIGAVEVEQEPREIGTSNYTPMRLFNQFLLVLTGYTTAPLRLSTLVGFGFVLFGVALLAYVLTNFFVRGSVPGFTFLAAIVAVFSGVQLFSLGLVGEYIGRIFDRTLERPTYVVRQTLGRDDDGN